MKLFHLIVGWALFGSCTSALSQPTSIPAPIYFHLGQHQEGVGRPQDGFPLFEQFKQNVKDELSLLDRYDVVSDQAFSDFIVSVILYMRDTRKDPTADAIFDWFNQSHQNLGYHFHPTTWEVNIRTDKIKDMDYDSAITEYVKWEQAYYDWSTFTNPPFDSNTHGTLDPNRLGGVQLMQQHFTKPLVNECLSIMNPAAGQVFRQKYSQVVGQGGNPHSYYSTKTHENLWMSDCWFSDEPGIYAYKMMGLFFTHTRSAAWLERLAPVSMLKQVLNGLPRDIPHFFEIHLGEPKSEDDPLEDHLEYLIKEFIPANPGSRFISTADIPELVVPNPTQFSMIDIEEACRYVLYNWHGRPPAYVKFNENYMSLASLFKGLQAALQFYLSQPIGDRTWPISVSVSDFIRPPIGRESSLPEDNRIVEGFSMDSMMTAVQELTNDDAIPYIVSIQDGLRTLQTNAAEFFNGMCNLFLKLRNEDSLGQMYILPAYIIPISNIYNEAAKASEQQVKTNMEWTGELQLWTLEPLLLKDLSDILSEY